MPETGSVCSGETNPQGYSRRPSCPCGSGLRPGGPWSRRRPPRPCQRRAPAGGSAGLRSRDAGARRHGNAGAGAWAGTLGKGNPRPFWPPAGIPPSRPRRSSPGRYWRRFARPLAAGMACARPPRGSPRARVTPQPGAQPPHGLAAALPSCTIGIETCQGAHQGQHFWWPLARPRLRTITPPMHSSGRRAEPCGPQKGRRTDATAAGACAARPAWTGRRRPRPGRRPCRGGFHPAGIRERKSILPNAPATVFRLHPDPRRTALQSSAAASHGRLALAWMMHTVARARIRLRCVQSRSRRVNFKISLGGRNGSSNSQKRSFCKSTTRQGD